MPVRVVVREAEVVDDPRRRHLLDDAERDRADRKRRPAPFVTAHAIARELLGELTGSDPRSLRFERRCTTCGSRAHGKPSLVHEAPWRFSLSYTGDLAVAAVTRDHEIGVDIEGLDEAAFDDFDRVTLAETEGDHLAGLTGERLLDARARVWARKEAVLKATGHGLVVDPTEVVVSAPSDPPRLLDWLSVSDAPPEVAMADLPLESSAHRAAVAVIGADELLVEEG